MIDTQHVTPTEARQGRPGWPVLYVLIAGLVLASIAAGIIFFGAKATDDVPNSSTKGVSEAPALSLAA
ncbi:hypothetical protein [Chelatococcus reniformis]|uniref:Uncharacterized protein n=1 Tax=Chelatococcus reniformis TaxID=1494448 RepID=A0A916UNF9_9HYPH|nr:hypothetical protein [Chelatococcus reniformis]GGC79148.1 hypothetical protein GCM10010994_41590 [Chelatococcus reniformis]